MAAREEGCGGLEVVAGSQAADPADGSQAGVSYNTRVRHTMAHKIGLNDTQYEPDIERRSALDFSSCSSSRSSSSRLFEDDDNNKGVLERTKGTTSDILVVRNNSDMVVSTYNHLQHHSVIESSSSSSSSKSLIGGGTKCLVNSRFLEDTSCGLTDQEEANNSRRCLSKVVEGRPVVVVESGLAGGEEEEEVMRNQDRGSFGSSMIERGTVGSANSIEAREQQQSLIMQASGAVMDPVDQRDPLLYSSDEWEESDLSDTDGDDDHSDSSDDDDPKSQVDRLIERGTLMYMDGENSNLSSEAESSDDDSSSGDDDSDSESDITDVSPLISATASPLGLSPVLPRRTLGTSPLALHDNRDLAVLDYRPEISSNDQGYDSQPHCNGSGHSNSDDSTDMTLLLKAVVELEKKQHKRHHNNHHHQHNNRHYNHHHHQNNHHHLNHHNNHHHHLQEPTSPITIHPIDASPHHSHLRKASQTHRRKNMSFSNDEVKRIDRENQILLHKIMSAHTKSKNQSSSNHNNRTVQRPANSTVNRKREEEKIRRENMILLRKIQEAKPSRDVTASRSPRHRTTPSVRPPSSLPATPGSCGASARTA